MHGHLKRIYKDLQYGFIRSGSIDYFFHKSDFAGDWHGICFDFEHGNPVELEFNPADTDKGPRARNVNLAPSIV